MAASGPTTMLLSTLALDNNRNDRHWVSSGPNAQGRYTWTELLPNDHSVIVGAFVNSSKVYFNTFAGEVYSYDIATGSRFLVTQGSTKALIGAEDPNTLYTQTQTSAGYHLERQSASGGAPTRLATHSTPFLDLVFDTNHFYFREAQANARQKIMRVAKSGGTASEYLSHATDTLYSPLTNGSYLWWRQGPKVLTDGTARLRRKNLSNGNLVSVDFPTLALHEMRLGSSNNIYITGLVSTNPDRYGLVRTAQ